MTDPRASRPKYGDSIARVDQGGRVIPSDQWEKFIDDLIGEIRSKTEATSSTGNQSVAALFGQFQRSKQNRGRTSTSGNYTATRFDQLIVPGANGTITLWDDPLDGDELILSLRDAYSITVNGNGNTINGNTTQSFERGNQTIAFRYWDVAGEWIIHSITGLTSQYTVYVVSPSQISSPQSGVLYIIDGPVDMGSTQITVPTGGMQVGGLGFEVSKLFSTENNYTLFTSASSGGVFFSGPGITIDVSGTSTKVFNLEDNTGFNAVELNNVNFENCTSLGQLKDFRQFLGRNLGFFGCDDGLEFVGTWLGGARIETSIVRTFGSSGTLFKEGGSLTFGSRFFLNLNIDLPSGTSSIADFQPSNFNVDSSFQCDRCIVTRNGSLDINDANYFPNISETDTESLWTANTGLKNTVMGGAWECTTESTTTVSASSTYYKLEGTTTVEGLDHMDDDSGTDNRLKLLTEEPKDMSVIASIKIEQATGFGDEVNLRLRVYRDATSSFEELRTVAASIPNLTSLANVAAIQLFDRVTMNQSDYLELWISNESGTGNLIMKEGSFFQVRRT